MQQPQELEHQEGRLEQLADALNAGLGARFYAMELELPRYARRLWKFGRLARVLGWLIYLRDHKAMPCEDGDEAMGVSA